MWSQKSSCIIDNIHLEKHVDTVLNIYIPLAKPSSCVTTMALYSLQYMPGMYHR